MRVHQGKSNATSCRGKGACRHTGRTEGLRFQPTKQLLKNLLALIASLLESFLLPGSFETLVGYGIVNEKWSMGCRWCAALGFAKPWCELSLGLPRTPTTLLPYFKAFLLLWMTSRKLFGDQGLILLDPL